MPPLMRWWFNLHRHNTRPLKDRNMHKLERAYEIAEIRRILDPYSDGYEENYARPEGNNE